MPARSAAQPESPSTYLDGKLGGWLIAVVAFLCVSALALASLRHTGSLAFPIDDGYIYSNYVIAAANGQPFQYNAGETSGGVTGLGWYVLSLLAYWLIAPFHTFFAALAPAVLAESEPLSAQAGHLYLAAYLPGFLCLVVAGLATWKLANLVLPDAGNRPLARSVLCWVLGVFTAADLGLTWGAMSGLEVSLSAALVALSAYLLLLDWRRGRPGWSLIAGAALPWARPDLLAVSVAVLLWLGMRVVFAHDDGQRRHARLFIVAYFAACAAGVALMSLAYYLGWGRPLPSSFYAKVGGIRLLRGFGAAVRQLIFDGHFLPIVTATLASLGGILSLTTPLRAEGSNEKRWSALLVLMCAAGYLVALLLTLPWFGQEDRYLLPVHPLVIVLLGALAWAVVRHISIEVLLSRRFVLAVIVLLFTGGPVLANYVWATRNYVVHVRNISDATNVPARWLAENTPPDAIVASEPIGAVKLFSERRTLDIVGLTSPAALGTYGNWPATADLLRREGARYLLFYPAWFDDGTPPAWAVERIRFTVPDNKIAGDSVIAIYELRWDGAEGR